MNQLIPFLEWWLSSWRNFGAFCLFLLVMFLFFAALITLWHEERKSKS